MFAGKVFLRRRYSQRDLLQLMMAKSRIESFLSMLIWNSDLYGQTKSLLNNINTEITKARKCLNYPV